jgi:hypothetical protein
VVPSYKGKIVFVNAIAGDASADRLAERFSFRYIPTSFFLEPEGTVSSSNTGPLAEVEMRARLDALVGR